MPVTSTTVAFRAVFDGDCRVTLYSICHQDRNPWVIPYGARVILLTLEHQYFTN